MRAAKIATTTRVRKLIWSMNARKVCTHNLTPPEPHSKRDDNLIGRHLLVLSFTGFDLGSIRANVFWGRDLIFQGLGD
jgi:hypothetical protein